MTKVYTITGQSRTKPEGLPSGFNVEETDTEFNRSIGAHGEGDNHIIRLTESDEDILLRLESFGKPRGVPDIYIGRAQVAELRDALTEWLGDAEPKPTVDTAYVVGLLRARRKLTAIRYYREVTSAGLREAKDAVERIEAEAGPVVVTADSPEPDRAAVFEDVDGDRWRYGVAGNGDVGWYFSESSNTWLEVAEEFEGSFPWTRV